jgi:hypothetical protein
MGLCRDAIRQITAGAAATVTGMYEYGQGWCCLDPKSINQKRCG